MIHLKDKGLTKVSLFKNNFCKSWAYLPKTGQIVIHDEDTPATNWTIYKGMNWMRGKAGNGYTVNFYKRGQGIIGAEPNKKITKKAS